MKRAICVGINNYPGTVNDLEGCVNDAEDWERYLLEIGFDEVTTILDKSATLAVFGADEVPVPPIPVPPPDPIPTPEPDGCLPTLIKTLFGA